MSSATWANGTYMTPVGAYETGSNWVGNIVPTEMATFGTSYRTVVQITANGTVGSWVIASAFTFTSSTKFDFTNQGIIGGAGSVFHNAGQINFLNGSSAGSILISNTASLIFKDSSTAGIASIVTSKTGDVVFAGGSTAGDAILVAYGEGSQNGRVSFTGDGPAHDHKITAGAFAGSGIFDIGSNTVTVGAAFPESNATVSGQIIGTASGRLIKAGTGMMTISGVGTYGGGTVVNQGTLVVTGALGAVTVGAERIGQVYDSPKLHSDGLLGATTIGDLGELSAGREKYSPGQLKTAGLNLQWGSTLHVDITGPNPGSGYDQISVAGKVKLAGALELAAFFPSFNDTPPKTMTIIDNDGKDKVIGTFDGGQFSDIYYFGKLEEGETFTTKSGVFSLSYKAGSGNDVVLRTESARVDGTTGADLIGPKVAPPLGQEKPTNRADLIYGRGGDDTIDAGKGNDTVLAGGGREVANGGAGKDYISYVLGDGAVQLTLKGSKAVTVKVDGIAQDKIKNFEDAGGGDQADKLTGDKQNNVLMGFHGNDKLTGGGGNDVLVGGEGKDVLVGGAGKDQFVFYSFPTADLADKVKDFAHNQDQIVLDRAIFHAIGAKLDKSEFHAKAGAHEAKDANDYIIYDTKSGKLYYDADGSGSDRYAYHVATLSGHPTLSAGDFLII